MERKTGVLTKEDILSGENLPGWFKKEYAAFHKTVTDDTFPCFFGRNAEKRGHLRYTWINRDDWSMLPMALGEFLGLLNKHSSIRPSFIVFVEPEAHEQNLDYYRHYFWNILQYIHSHDPRAWPEGQPTDPAHHLWDFHFQQEPMFVFGNAPAYKQRRSRNLGDSLILGFQPRRIFQGLEGTEPGGIMSREKVRERTEKWDGLPKHPDISHFGDPGHYEWKQFFIGDDANPIEGTCPFYYGNKM